MDCPKCGFSQADGLEECSSCGVMFDRWRMAQERASLAARSTEVQFEPAERGLPRWMVAVALLAVVGLGAVWTVRMRQARARRDPVRTLMEEASRRNLEGNRIRQNITEAEAAARRQHYLAQKRVNEQSVAYLELRWPDGLTAEMAAEMIERCPGFIEPEQEVIPSTFSDLAYRSTVEQYPVLLTALRERLVELDPPLDEIREADSYEQLKNNARTIWVKPTADGLSSLSFHEANGRFQVDLGRRRLDGFKRIYPTYEASKVEFYWKFERAGGVRLRSGGRPQGWIEVVKDGNSWRLRDGMITEGTREIRVCS